MQNIQYFGRIFGIFAKYSVFSRILGILQNILFRQNIRLEYFAEYSAQTLFRSDSITNAGQDEGGERGEGIGSSGVKSDFAILADPQTLVRPFPS